MTMAGSLRGGPCTRGESASSAANNSTNHGAAKNVSMDISRRKLLPLQGGSRLKPYHALIFGFGSSHAANIPTVRSCGPLEGGCVRSQTAVLFGERRLFYAAAFAAGVSRNRRNLAIAVLSGMSRLSAK